VVSSATANGDRDSGEPDATRRRRTPCRCRSNRNGARVKLLRLGGREAVPGPVFGHLREVVEASEKRWNLSLLEAHRTAYRCFAWSSRRPCREAAVLLAGAGVLPEPEAEEGAHPPALGQRSWELGGASSLAGGAGAARTPVWRLRANIEAHATSRRCAGTQRKLSGPHAATRQTARTPRRAGVKRPRSILPPAPRPRGRPAQRGRRANGR
jgi:hypothetical protein